MTYDETTAHLRDSDGYQVAEALDRNFTSPNVWDSNLEPANMVDALDSVARGLYAIARAIHRAAGIDPDDPAIRNSNESNGDPQFTTRPADITKARPPSRERRSREAVPMTGITDFADPELRLRLLDTHLLLTTEPPPLDWLVDGVFCRGKLALVGGREKRGKSLIQLALAVKMASGGGELAGLHVKPGRVLLVDAENGEREIHRRLRAMGLEPKHAGGLLIAEARGFDLRYNLEEVADLAHHYEVDLVLSDSFRALWLGDERDEADVAEALDPLRDLAHDTNTAYALTHHAQKGGDEYRGSTSIGASIEWCVMVDRVHDDPQKATRRRLSNPLARFAPERPERWLQIRSDGDDGPVSLEAAEAFVREHDTPVRDEVEYALMAVIKEGCGGVAALNGDHTPTPPSWNDTGDLARAVGRKPKDWTVRKAVERLADQGVIHRNGDNRWSPTPTLFDEEEAEP